MTPAAAQAILDHAKQANEASVAEALAQVQRQKAQLLNQQALKTIGKVMLGGLGAGMALRGAKGLYNAVRPSPPAPSQPVILDIPQHRVRDKEKAAGLGDYLGDVMGGRAAETVAGVPGVWPGVLIGGGLGAYGGWKALDKVLDARRKAELQEDLSTSEQRYRQALLGQYKASELGQAMDNLAKASASDWPGIAAGTYLTAAPLIALLAARKGYDMGKKRTRRYAVEKAKKVRQQQLQRQRPPEIFARPVEAPATPEQFQTPVEIEQETGVTEGAA